MFFFFFFVFLTFSPMLLCLIIILNDLDSVCLRSIYHGKHCNDFKAKDISGSIVFAV